MKRFTKHLVLASIAGAFPVLISAAPVRALSLIADGGFETPTLPVGGQQVFNAGTTLGAWNVVGDSGTQAFLLQTQYAETPHGMTAFNAFEGLNSLDLSGPGNHGPTLGVQQSVATTPGASYQLTFYVGQAISNNGASIYQGPAMIDLSINGGSRTTFTNDNNGAAGQLTWKPFSVTFVATSATTSIEFLNNTSETTNEAGLDDVSLVAAGGGAGVPEPASLLTLSAACTVLAFRLRRRN